MWASRPGAFLLDLGGEPAVGDQDGPVLAHQEDRGLAGEPRQVADVGLRGHQQEVDPVASDRPPQPLQPPGVLLHRTPTIPPGPRFAIAGQSRPTGRAQDRAGPGSKRTEAAADPEVDRGPVGRVRKGSRALPAAAVVVAATATAPVAATATAPVATATAAAAAPVAAAASIGTAAAAPVAAAVVRGDAVGAGGRVGARRRPGRSRTGRPPPW